MKMQFCLFFLVLILCLLSAHAEETLAAEPVNNDEYQRAVDMIDGSAEAYDAAYEILWRMSGYKDADELCYQYGVWLIKNERYSEAYIVFMRLCGYQDADMKAYMIRVCTTWGRVCEKLTSTSVVYEFNGLYGIADFENNNIAPPKWKLIKPITINFYAVKEGELWGVADVHGNSVFAAQWQNISNASENRCVTYDGAGFGLIDLNGTVLQKCVWKQIGSSHVDIKGNLILVAPQYSLNRIRVQDRNNHWGYVDENGNVAIAVKYQSATEFDGDFATVLTEHNGYMVIDASGAEVLFTNYTYFERIYYANYSHAIELYQAEEYENAILAFSALGFYRDSERMVLASYYGIGKRQFSQDDYEGAIEAFSKAEDYPGAHAAQKAAKYALAQYVFEKEKDYQRAIELFGEISDYEDSAARQADVAYQYACELLADGFFVEAEQVLIGEYAPTKNGAQWEEKRLTAKAMQSIKASMSYGLFSKNGYYDLLLYDEACIYLEDASQGQVSGIVISINNQGNSDFYFKKLQMRVDGRIAGTWAPDETISSKGSMSCIRKVDDKDPCFSMGRHEYEVTLDDMKIGEGTYEIKAGESGVKKAVRMELEELDWTPKLAVYDEKKDTAIYGFTAYLSDLKDGETYISTLQIQNSGTKKEGVVLRAILDGSCYSWKSRALNSSLESILTIPLTLGRHTVTYYYNGVLLCEQEYEIMAERQPGPYYTGEKTVQFGRYWQETDPAKELKPIEWTVLDIINGSALLISQNAINSMPFSTGDANVLWETSTLREWMNGGFLYSSFTEEELELIEETLVFEAPDASDSKPLFDSVFALSEEEAERYFPTDAERVCSNSIGKGFSQWWLRTHGNADGEIRYVCYNGSIASRNGSISSDVRPCIWVKLKNTIREVNSATESIRTDMALVKNGMEAFPGGNRVDISHLQEMDTLSVVVSLSCDGRAHEKYTIAAISGDRIIDTSIRTFDETGKDTLNLSVPKELGQKVIQIYINGLLVGEYEYEIKDLCAVFNVLFGSTWKSTGMIAALSGEETIEETFANAWEAVKQRVYTSARTLINEGRYEEAIEAFTQLGDYRDSSGQILEAKYLLSGSLIIRGDYTSALAVLSDIHGYKLADILAETCKIAIAAEAEEAREARLKPYKTVGGTVAFGNYPQTSEGNDETPIEWQVLEVQEKRALLISKYGLDAKPYNTSYTGVTWETCTLRTWLNSDFLNKAFDTDEQKAILISNVDNSDSNGYSKWSANAGNNTQDKVFLLSCTEANKYFGVTHDGNNSSISCVVPTAYAIKQGASVYRDSSNTVNEYIADWWWLRSPGSIRSRAAGVNYSGSLESISVHNKDASIRPAIWLDLDEIYSLIKEGE